MTALTPLGDQAALAYFPDEAAALAFARTVRAAAPAWLVDVVSSYASVAVFYQAEDASYASVAELLHRLEERHTGDAAPAGRLHRIPCCYDLALDMERVGEHTGLAPAEVIARHAGQEYTVYAIGFCPGFPYLGYLAPELCNVPRLESPRLRVEPGSVGLTGRQTGIYTEPRPGGWNIVGRTPLVLVDVAAGYFPLRAGDRVRFDPIDRGTFARLQGQQLT